MYMYVTRILRYKYVTLTSRDLLLHRVEGPFFYNIRDFKANLSSYLWSSSVYNCVYNIWCAFLFENKIDK